MTCLNEHGNCRSGVARGADGSHHAQSLDSPCFPTRILEVTTAPDSREITCRLKENQACSGRARYACLSYCWGPQEQSRLLLTKGLQKQFTQEIHMNELDQTLQDAVRVVHGLGMQYLWIDALCIVQDDPADKAVELARMQDIYKNAELVILAASAAASNEGFLRPNPIHDLSICDFPAMVQGRSSRLSLHHAAEYDATAAGKHGHAVQLDHPVHKRAWTLQECVLARRILIFSNFEVLWHCSQRDDISVLPSFLGRPPKGLIPWDRRQVLEPLMAQHRNSPPQWFPQWLELVDDYMSRKMSNPSDSLRALEGVIRSIELETGDKFIFGLSRRYLVWSLLWHVPSERDARWPESAPNELAPSVPSWSWAAQKWPVTMNLCLDFMPGAQVLDIRDVSVDCSIPAVRLCGRLQQAATCEQRGPGVVLRDPVSTEPCHDTDDAVYLHNAIYLYLGRSERLSRNFWVHRGLTIGHEDRFEFFLVLERLSNGCYRRTGLYTLSYRGDFKPFGDGWKEACIWIV